MSKVKIQGNASGTGVVTLTAPNTNTDRTITLPDGDISLGVGIDDNATSTAITIDASENVGIGVTPSAFNASYTGINIGKTGTLIAETAGNDGLYIGSNAYYSTGNNYKYIMDGKACELKMDASASHFKFRTASSGTAGNAITFTDRLEITDDGRGLSQFTAKAWVNFNGTGTPAYADSHNCSSLTDVGTGHYTINFTNSMANTNYSKVVDCRDVNHSTTLVVAHSSDTYGTGSFHVLLQYLGVSTGAVDEADIHFIVFGD